MFAPLLHTIKLTSHINPRLGYDSHPRFDAEVWSLLRGNAASIEEVFLFLNSYWRGDTRRFAMKAKVSQRIASLGASRQMTDDQWDELRGWTNGDNQFSVLYLARASSDVLPLLVNLYTRGGAISDERRDDTGLKEDEAAELRLFVAMHSPAYSVVGFSSNADPCYIFNASPDALLLVLDRAALLASPSVR